MCFVDESTRRDAWRAISISTSSGSSAAGRHGASRWVAEPPEPEVSAGGKTKTADEDEGLTLLRINPPHDTHSPHRTCRSLPRGLLDAPAAQCPDAQLLPADGAGGCDRRCGDGPGHDQRLSAQQGPGSTGRRPGPPGRRPGGSAGNGIRRQAEFGQCGESAPGIRRVQGSGGQPVGRLLHAGRGLLRLAREPAA